MLAFGCVREQKIDPVGQPLIEYVQKQSAGGARVRERERPPCRLSGGEGIDERRADIKLGVVRERIAVGQYIRVI